jgi:ubiquitin-like protein Pup
VSQPSEQHRSKRDDEHSEAPPPATSADKAALDADVDSLLDEIDDVLEENAEEFVRGFVQKGGQ